MTCDIKDILGRVTGRGVLSVTFAVIVSGIVVGCGNEGDGSNENVVFNDVASAPSDNAAFDASSCQSGANDDTDSDNTDSDGDGLSDCEERHVYGTNPHLDDSDGDSFFDGDETVLFDPENSYTRFNPRVADLAHIEIDLTSVPQIELNFTESDGSSRTVATQHDTSTSMGVSRSRGGESTRQLEVGHTLSVEATQSVSTTTKAEFSLTDFGVSTSQTYEASLSIGFETTSTSTRGSSVNWTDTQQRENSETFSESEEISRSSGTSYAGGTLRMTARIRNSGTLAYDLQNLTLSAFRYDPARPFDIEPVANLEFSANGFPTTSLLTRSESAPLNFTADLSLPQARRLLRDSADLVVLPATFRLLDADSSSILLRDLDVAAQTATIIIDFGARTDRLETHRVAVNRGDDSRSISALVALKEVLGLRISDGEGEWTYADDSSPSATRKGLLAIDGVEHSKESNRYWYGAHHNSAGTQILNLLDRDGEGYELDHIELRAGDTLSFVLVGDADRDALPDRYEREYGTSPDSADTDSDGLSDPAEIYGSALAESCGDRAGLRVYSNPLAFDTDGDGKGDAAEVADCESPGAPVTAEAGNMQDVKVGAGGIRLQGAATGSFTGVPEYSWRLVSGPSITVDNVETRTLEGPSPIFTAPDEVSTLVFELEVVVDSERSSDRVAVQVLQNLDSDRYVGVNPDGVGDGSRADPYNTLEEAIIALSGLTPPLTSDGWDLYVMKRPDEPYTLVNPLVVPANTDLFGGYDTNWIRDTTEVSRTRVVLARSDLDYRGVFEYETLSNKVWLSGFILESHAGSASVNSEHSLVALRASGAAEGELILSHMTLDAGDIAGGALEPTASPGSSYGAVIRDLRRLELRSVLIKSGHGGVGANGAGGANGANGSDRLSGLGGSGGNGAEGFDGLDGGNGGNGGSRGSNGRNGDRGEGKDGGAGGVGGSVGTRGIPPVIPDRPVTPGSAGAPGAAGAPGYFDLGDSLGFVLHVGDSGGGGGGGGASGGTFSADRGGGGGGGGGAGAGGGGASIGLLITGINNVDIRDSTIRAGTGGAGGDGGSGGVGGDGGAGEGDSTSFSSSSAGGVGGNGGGGGGGPSIAVVIGEVSGNAPALRRSTLASGNGGKGGARGSQAGRGGDSIVVLNLLGDDVVPVLTDTTFLVGEPGEGGDAGDGGSPGNAGCVSEVVTDVDMSGCGVNSDSAL